MAKEASKMDFKRFVHRQQVLRFYREIMRSINKSEHQGKLELKAYVKGEFVVDGPDLEGNKFLLKNGQRLFKQMAGHLL